MDREGVGEGLRTRLGSTGEVNVCHGKTPSIESDIAKTPSSIKTCLEQGRQNQAKGKGRTKSKGQDESCSNSEEEEKGQSSCKCSPDSIAYMAAKKDFLEKYLGRM